MKKLIGMFVFVIFLVVPVQEIMAKKKNVIRATGGTNIGESGLVIDAGYDKRLDAFVPGYKVVNVALINQSFNIIMLDPEGDVWSVKLEGGSRPQRAIHDLRSADPKVWSQIPERAKGLVSYPLAIPIGAREVIDIFVPESLDMERFNELDIYIKSMGVKFEILVRQ